VLKGLNSIVAIGLYYPGGHWYCIPSAPTVELLLGKHSILFQVGEKNSTVDVTATKIIVSNTFLGLVVRYFFLSFPKL